MKKIIFLIVSISIVIIGVGIGIKKDFEEKKSHQEKVEIVKSEEVKEKYEKVFNSIDPKVHTPEGFIQSYEIDYKSINPHITYPIRVKIIINDDENLFIRLFILKWAKESTYFNISANLAKQLDEHYE